MLLTCNVIPSVIVSLIELTPNEMVSPYNLGITMHNTWVWPKNITTCLIAWCIYVMFCE